MRSAPLAVALLLALGVAAPARADDATKPAKHKVTQSDSYLSIEPIYSAILDGDHPVGMLMIGIGLDVPDAKLRAEAMHAMPLLRDAFVRNLLNYSTTSVRPWRQPDVVEIANRLQAVADRALGRKGARLLLAQVAMRITK